MRTKRRYRTDCDDSNEAEELVYLPQVLVDYNVAAIPTRDTLPYGTQTVWNGQNLSGLGNIASGAYAFVIAALLAVRVQKRLSEGLNVGAADGDSGHRSFL